MSLNPVCTRGPTQRPMGLKRAPEGFVLRLAHVRSSGQHSPSNRGPSGNSRNISPHPRLLVQGTQSLNGIRINSARRLPGLPILPKSAEFPQTSRLSGCRAVVRSASLGTCGRKPTHVAIRTYHDLSPPDWGWSGSVPGRWSSPEETGRLGDRSALESAREVPPRICKSDFLWPPAFRRRIERRVGPVTPADVTHLSDRDGTSAFTNSRASAAASGVSGRGKSQR